MSHGYRVRVSLMYKCFSHDLDRPLIEELYLSLDGRVTSGRHLVHRRTSVTEEKPANKHPAHLVPDRKGIAKRVGVTVPFNPRLWLNRGERSEAVGWYQ